MTILGSYWFSPMNSVVIGVVMVQTEHDGVQYYIGAGAGLSKEQDELKIAETGASFPFHAGRVLFRPYGLDAGLS